MKLTPAKKRLGITILLLAAGGAGWWGWWVSPILPENPPPLTTYQNEQGFLATRPPENTSLATVAKRDLDRLFQFPEEKSFLVEDEINLGFYLEQSNWAKEMWPLPKGEEIHALKELFKGFKGAKVSPNSPITGLQDPQTGEIIRPGAATITSSQGEDLRIPFVRSLGARLASIIFYQEKLGLFIEPTNQGSHAIYLLPINPKNIRTYIRLTEEGKPVLEDKSYPWLQENLHQVSDKDFYEKTILTILYGFKEEWMPENPEEQILLLDITGIYLAETFRTHRDPTEPISPTLTGCILLGLMENHKKTAKDPQTVYKNLSQHLEIQGVPISADLKANHPILYPLWKKAFGAKDANVLTAFNLYLNNPGRGSRYEKWLVKKFIAALADLKRTAPEPVETGKIYLSK